MTQDNMTAAQSGSHSTVDPGKGTPVIVDVRAWRAETNGQKSGPVLYDLEWRFEGQNPKTDKTIHIPANTPATPIHFHFHDDTGLKLQFYSPADEAMYVGTGSECPPSKGDGGQISFISSANNLLKVEDANSGAEVTLKYALRFDGDPYVSAGVQCPPFVYDPDIRNGGGGNLNE